MPSTDSSNFFNDENNISPRSDPWAFRLALCLMPLVLFFSMVFSLLSPLPILYLHAGSHFRKQGFFWAVVASLLGTVLCFLLKGPGIAAAFLLLSVLPGLVMGELLLRKLDPALTIAITAITICLIVFLGAITFAKSQNTTPGQAFTQVLDKTALDVKQWIAQNGAKDNENNEELQKLLSDPQLVKQEVPGIVFAGALLLCAISCVTLVRWNPKGFTRRANIRRDYLRKWRTPDWFVWLALFCAVFRFFEVHYLTTIATNLTNPIVLIYFFQGMSILAFFLDSLRIRGPLRALIYGSGIFFLTPLIVSFGFFDLWLNLRSRRQTEEEEDKP